MSTIDTSTWNPDPALNESIGDIPLNESASIKQTWQAIQMLMAAGGLHGLQLVTFDGATASADGKQGLVPAPEAGDQGKVLKGDGTWGTVAAASHTHGNITSDGKLGTASRAVVTDGNKAIGVSSVTSTELGYLSGVTSGVQSQLNAKAADSGVVHSSGDETVAGTKTFTSAIVFSHDGAALKRPDKTSFLLLVGGDNAQAQSGAKIYLYGGSSSSQAGEFLVQAGNATTGYKQLAGKPDGTLTWDGGDITGDVHSSGAETIAGEKTFSSCIFTTSDATLRHKNASGLVQIGFSPMANGPNVNLFGKSYSTSSKAGTIEIISRNASGTTKVLYCTPDGTLTWDGQAIQTASDERLKTPLFSVPDAVLDAWGDVQWGQFQFLEALSAKGESARLHLGLIAQRVKAVFEARGLDACEYGILCHEVHPATADEPATDLWMVRYAEAQAMEAAFQRRKADRLEKRLADLEARMTAMEAADA